jgi:hypothetical protein
MRALWCKLPSLSAQESRTGGVPALRTSRTQCSTRRSRETSIDYHDGSPAREQSTCRGASVGWRLRRSSLARAYAEEPAIARTWTLDFAPALTRLLTATCVGLLTQATDSGAETSLRQRAR